MRIRRVVMAICFSAFTLVTSRAGAQNADQNGELSILFWKPSPELTIRSGALTGATGITNVDFVSEFGIEDKWFTEFRAALGHKHKLRFSYVPIKYAADATIQRTITFRGQTFRIGAPAHTDIKWDIWKYGYEFDFVSLDKGFVGVVADVKYNKISASIASPALTTTAATEQKAPVPTIGIAFRGYPARMVAIGGEFGGLKLSHGTDTAKYIDFDVNGIVTLGRYIGAQAGYRSITVDYVIDDDSGNLKMKGPYVGGILKF